jgi:hypothetical protein
MLFYILALMIAIAIVLIAVKRISLAVIYAILLLTFILIIIGSGIGADHLSIPPHLGLDGVSRYIAQPQ